jgi:adenylate cyclase
VFELLGLAGESNGRHIKLCRNYGDALAAYRARQFQGALDALKAGSAEFPEDGPSQWLKARCMALLEVPPPVDWEPVTTATEK